MSDRHPEFGANIGANMMHAEHEAGHTIHTVPMPEHVRVKEQQRLLHPIGVYFPMEEPSPDTGHRRLTLDALTAQRGEAWFARVNPANAFMVSEARFTQELRIHNIKLNPFTLDREGRIASPGSLVMEIPGKWQCPACERSTRDISFTRLKRLQPASGSRPRCQACPGQPQMVRISDPLRRPPSEHPTLKAMFQTFQNGTAQETLHFVPRIWASYRVSDAPPDEAWQLHPDDVEGNMLESLSREKYAMYSRSGGTAVAIQSRGPAPGSGWHVFVSPDGGIALDSVVRSPVQGSILHVYSESEAAPVTAVYITPDGAERTPEAAHKIELNSSDGGRDMDNHHGDFSVIVREGDRVTEGSIIAHPTTWHAHDVDGRGTLVVTEGDEVTEGQALSEGYTIRPVKLAIDLKTPGIQALSMETTHNEDQQPAMKVGWLSWPSMLGALTREYGYTVYLAKEHKRHMPRRGEDRARV